MVMGSYMDRREVRISMEELERSFKSFVSVSNRLQQEVSDEVDDNVHNLKKKSIEEDLLQHSEASPPAEFCWIIPKVPYRLRQVNEIAYVPKLISIGPYHHDKEHLKAAKVIKRRYFIRMIEETGVEPKEFIDAMKEQEEAIRNCYQGPLDHIDSDTFVGMLVLDGCFILQLLRGNVDVRRIKGIQDDIQYDLFLLENQLPFSVLLNLYSIIMNAGQQEIKEEQQVKKELYGLALSYFQDSVLKEKIPARTGDINRYHDYHLLGLVHDSWLSSYEKNVSDASEDNDSPIFISCATALVKAGINFRRKVWKASSSDIDAIDLEKAGINFEGEGSLLDIDFVEGTKELKIPRLTVDDNTELILRNMMAYEQFIINSDRPTLVCDYVTFMDNLIDTGKDVKLLREAEIIENWLGNDEAVAKMFNRLRDFITLANNFHYKEISRKVKKHCIKRRYKWMATLKRDYFNSPWSYISFFAALLLLALTMAQTIFSVLSYVDQ